MSLQTSIGLTPQRYIMAAVQWKDSCKTAEKNQMMIGRALCRADWPTDCLTGLLANWFGVFLVCSWNGEGHWGKENVPK